MYCKQKFDKHDQRKKASVLTWRGEVPAVTPTGESEKPFARIGGSMTSQRAKWEKPAINPDRLQVESRNGYSQGQFAINSQVL